MYWRVHTNAVRRKGCVKRLALPRWQLTALAEVQEPECAAPCGARPKTLRLVLYFRSSTYINKVPCGFNPTIIGFTRKGGDTIFYVDFQLV
jgi:hypothetical protein